MAVSTTKLYIGTDDIVLLEGLIDNNDSTYINDATVLASLYEDEIVYPDVAGPAVDKGGGDVGIPMTAHSFAAGDEINIRGSENYEGEYTIQSETTNEIVITETYVAEIFVGVEEIYKNVEGAYQIVMSYVAASNGNYSATLPDTLRLVVNDWYYLFVDVTDTSSNKKLIRKKVQAAYASS